MDDRSYTTSFQVKESPDEVFAAINNVRGWWTGDIEGSTDQLGDEFSYRYEDLHYSKQKVVESIAGQKVVWGVLEADLSFANDTTEWTGTEISFEITKQGDQTEVRFTHVGLVPDYECFDSCSNAWGYYINTSLRNLITKGQGQPNQNADVAEKRGLESV